MCSHQESVLEVVNVNGSEMTEEPCQPEVHKNRNRDQISGSVAEAFRNTTSAKSEKQNENSEHCTNDFLDAVDGPWNLDVDNHSVVYSGKESTSRTFAEEVQYDAQLKKMSSCAESDLNGMTNVAKVIQQRNIGDEIAQCDEKIQTILNGGEDVLELKIDLISEGCNYVCLRSGSQERTSHDYEDQCTTQYVMPEESLSKQNPCQELDVICNENDWILPAYQVFPSYEVDIRPR